MGVFALIAILGGFGQVECVVDAGRVVGRVDQGLWANVGYDPMWMATCNEAALFLWRWVREHGALVRVRCHNTFTSGLPARPWPTWPVGYFGCDIYHEGPDGQPQYNFYWLDDVLDVWVAAGISPIIELDFMPDRLADGLIRRNMESILPREEVRRLISDFPRYVRSPVDIKLKKITEMDRWTLANDLSYTATRIFKPLKRAKILEKIAKKILLYP